MFYGAIGRDTGFMMKKEWFFWPLGPFFRWMGGIAVDRGRHTSLVDQVIKIAKEIPAKIIICGGEPTQEYLDLKKQYNADNIEFLGFKKKQELK